MANGTGHRVYSLAEYVQLEAYANVRHEFLNGQVYAMAGGTPEHGMFAANLIGILTNALADRPCRVRTSDVRVRVQATGLDTYPDISVVCGRAEHDPEDPNALANPVVLVEVLSPSTEEYDRGEKFEHYRQISSLREVVFISHDLPRVEVMRRGPNGGWVSTAAGAGASVRLESIDCEVPVDRVYRDPLA